MALAFALFTWVARVVAKAEQQPALAVAGPRQAVTQLVAQPSAKEGLQVALAAQDTAKMDGQQAALDDPWRHHASKPFSKKGRFVQEALAPRRVAKFIERAAKYLTVTIAPIDYECQAPPPPVG